MKKNKYVMIGGFAFSDKTDMKKLKKLAKKGWLLKSFKNLRYELEKGEPQDLDFVVDYRDELDEDYLMAFEKSGWNHVASTCHVHIFSAKEGTKPIYTDKESEKEKLLVQEKSLKKPMIISILLLIGFIIIGELFISGTEFFGYVFAVIISFFLIATVFTTMPYFGYKIRRKLLNRKK